MKKLSVIMYAVLMLSGITAVNATPVATSETPALKQSEKVEIKQKPSKEEIIKMHKEREAAFEKRLGLTDAQKQRAKEIRIQGMEKIKPVYEQIKLKKQEAKMVKLSRMAVQMQEEKLAVIDNELKDLEKQANQIRKQNMKDFESILTWKQKRILKQMKKEGRKKFEKSRLHQPPCKIDNK